MHSIVLAYAIKDKKKIVAGYEIITFSDLSAAPC